jgi:hypothetical protein
MTSNLPTIPSEDSAEEVKNFFDKFFQQQITFPASQVDAVVGYFMKRGFSDDSAKSTAIVLLNQAKIDNVNVFQLLDTLQGLGDAQLSGIVTEILNSTRDKTSTLGFKIIAVEETIESRNIKP